MPQSRCGPEFNNTKCSGSSCCSKYSWCGGDIGVKSDFCHDETTGSFWVGTQRGKFDGIPKVVNFAVNTKKPDAPPPPIIQPRKPFIPEGNKQSQCLKLCMDHHENNEEQFDKCYGACINCKDEDKCRWLQEAKKSDKIKKCPFDANIDNTKNTKEGCIDQCKNTDELCSPNLCADLCNNCSDFDKCSSKDMPLKSNLEKFLILLNLSWFTI